MYILGRIIYVFIFCYHSDKQGGSVMRRFMYRRNYFLRYVYGKFFERYQT